MQVLTISGKARHGKDTTANAIQRYFEAKGKRVCILHYADYLKLIAQKYFGWDGEKNETGRTLLQWLGTNVARQRNPDIWVRVACEFLSAFGPDFDYVLIPDTRFPNEIKYLREHGYDVTAINVRRLDFDNGCTEEQKNHPSETALDDFPFDVTIACPSGAENVQMAVNDYLHNTWPKS